MIKKQEIKKERVVVVCPGRGTYTKETLGYLKKFRPAFSEFLNVMDEKRAALGMPTLSELDQEPVFKPQLHTKGEHASALIYACSYADFLNLDPEKYEVVAVTGNSMGWYSALAVAGVLDVHGAFEVINTMGSMMKDEIIGGQMIYPLVNDQWQMQPKAVKMVQESLKEANEQPGCEAYLSIQLGGYAVIGGNQPAINFLLKKLPKIENYPFQLINHAAFHTPLLKQTSEKAMQILSKDLFHQPKIPLIDGRGHVWTEFATSQEDIYNYTLDHQVVCQYDFTTAITVALKEFCPDRFILLGPGNTLGGAIGQIFVQNNWLQMASKSDFTERQKENPFLISLGRP